MVKTIKRKRIKSKNNNSSLKELSELLKELSLTTIARDIQDLLTQAEMNGPGYSQFLHNLLLTEKSARTDRKTFRNLNRSKLGIGPVDFKGFDFTARPKLPPGVVKELLLCKFIEDRRNIILVGKSSTGKTTVAKTIGRAACNLGYSVLYQSMADILRDLYASHADDSYLKIMSKLIRYDLLILDDAGFENLSVKHTNELFRLVSARHRQRSFIVASNLPFKKWAEFIPSPAQAVAIADRLIDNATILRFSGKPYRKPLKIYGAPLED